jgi:hypothetical protein
VQQRRIFTDTLIPSVESTEQELDYESSRPNIKKPPRECERHEAVISSSSDRYWVLRVHESHDQMKERSHIKPYDLCLFQHTLN